MKTKQWGIFAIEKEVELIKEIVEKKGYEVFEVRKLNFWEKLMYCKDPLLYANDPWVIMFNATQWQYKRLVWKLKLKPIF